MRSVSTHIPRALCSAPSWSQGQDFGPPGRRAHTSGGGWPDPALGTVTSPPSCRSMLGAAAPLPWETQRPGGRSCPAAAGRCGDRKATAGRRRWLSPGHDLWLLSLKCYGLHLACSPASVFSGEARKGRPGSGLTGVGSGPCARGGQSGLWVWGAQCRRPPCPCSPRASRVSCPPGPSPQNQVQLTQSTSPDQRPSRCGHCPPN